MRSAGRWVLALAVLAGFAGFACGDDDDDSPAATATPAGSVASPTPSSAAHPSDPAGSQDFAGIERYPGSWITEYNVAGRGVHHCGGLKNDFINEVTLQRYGVDGAVAVNDVLQYFKGSLTQSGWALATEGARVVSFERDLVDCGDGVVKAREGVVVTFEESGYLVERAYLEGTSPYAD